MKVQRQIDELLALRASEWFELLPQASPEQLREFDAWLCESRLHCQEFLEIAQVEFCLGNLDPQRRVDVEALVKRIAPAVTSLHRESQPPRRRWTQAWQGVGLAAACAAVAAAGALWFARLDAANRYITHVGEQRIVELADASVVTLNADSKIKVNLQSDAREIDLQRGEAIFKVAQDAHRPFRVRTRAGVVQAVGTQFNVRERTDGSTRVSVLEGRVRAIATTSATDQGAEILLDAGEEADLRLDGSIQRKTQASVANAVAWREHRLVFEGAPLTKMVAEFNRHNASVQLRLEGLEGDTRRYDGAFDATDPASLGTLLTRESDLKVERRGKEIVISPRNRTSDSRAPGG